MPRSGPTHHIIAINAAKISSHIITAIWRSGSISAARRLVSTSTASGALHGPSERMGHAQGGPHSVFRNGAKGRRPWDGNFIMAALARGAPHAPSPGTRPSFAAISGAEPEVDQMGLTRVAQDETHLVV
jgi:hypothetical protein